MPIIIFFAYLLIEALTFWGVSHLIGVGWAFLALFALMVLGVVLAGTQMSQVARAAIKGERSAGRSAVDYGLITAGSICLALPGFVSSLVGLLLIIPPTRGLVRNVLAIRTKRWVEKLGMRGFEAAGKYRPTTNYGSFGGPVIDAEPDVDERDINEWTKNIKPEDFNK